MLDTETIELFLQHAHRRIEGWLIEFEEKLDEGLVELPLLESARAELRRHMYVEEKLVFPRAEHKFKEVVALLLEGHGFIWDAAEKLWSEAHRQQDIGSLKKSTQALARLLAIHSAEEDMGIYPDLLDLLGPAASAELLRSCSVATAPQDWVCSARCATRPPTI